MKKVFGLPVVLALSLLTFIPAQANGSSADHDALVKIIEAVAHGWETGDGTAFRENFLDFEGARYVESGGQNEGLDDLVTHHVEPEGDALAGFKLTFNEVETNFEGDFAWAIVRTEIQATVRKDDREIHNRGYQTFLFRRIDGAWKVVHTHSSSRPVKK